MISQSWNFCETCVIKRDIRMCPFVLFLVIHKFVKALMFLTGWSSFSLFHSVLVGLGCIQFAARVVTQHPRCCPHCSLSLAFGVWSQRQESWISNMFDIYDSIFRRLRLDWEQILLTPHTSGLFEQISCNKPQITPLSHNHCGGQIKLNIGLKILQCVASLRRLYVHIVIGVAHTMCE